MGHNNDNGFDDIDDTILQGESDSTAKPARRRTSATKRQDGARKRSSSARSVASGVLGSFSGIAQNMRVTQLILWCVLFLVSLLVLVWYRKFGSAFLFGTAGMIGFFLYLFTGMISQVKMNGMVVYCYLFTAVVLIGSVVPSFYFNKFVFFDQRENMLTSPLGIIKACKKGDKKDLVAPEMDCKRENTQWVLNIGGTIQHKFVSDCVTTDYKCINREKKQFPGRYKNNKVQITGGLVIPIYILMLAVIGAAINMTRRVPEYQRQVHLYTNRVESEDPDLEPHPDEITYEDAREFMVFQLMQVISAPMIAVTAYYLLTPSTAFASVSLGVVSGFAAETILVSLRVFADKLTPGMVSRARPS